MSDVVIRAPRPDDVGPLTRICNEPGVRRGTMRMPFTPDELIRKRLFEAPDSVTPLVAERTGQVTGQGALILRGGRQRHVGDVFLYVSEAHWGQGVGRALLAALLDLADNWHGLRRLQLEVLTDNDRAIALYESCGFDVEGRLRGQLLVDGELRDCFVMGRLHPAPTLEGSA